MNSNFTTSLKEVDFNKSGALGVLYHVSTGPYPRLEISKRDWFTDACGAPREFLGGE